MKTYTKEEIDAILKSHALWVQGDEAGVRADLKGANLKGADLVGANLWGAYLDS